MRREWSGWIKTRQWSEFEKLAKVEPSQYLADTVAELELGFPDKPDRRALRKILFLLAQAGYEPREIDEGEARTLTVGPMSVAFSVSPDGSGDSVFTIGREQKGRVAWLIAHVTYLDGITRAIEDTTPLDEAQTRLIRLRNMAPTATLSAEVPVEYAYERLARAVSVTKSLPPVMAYWRALLPKEYQTSHPAEGLPRTAVALEDLRRVIKNQKQLAYWRLELGSLTQALDTFLKNYADKSAPEQVGELEWWNTILTEDRESLFTFEAIEDHWFRLLDLAYIMHLRGDAGSGDVLAVADDLRKRGTHSEYAKSMTTKTFLLLFETIRQTSTERSERTRGA